MFKAYNLEILRILDDPSSQKDWSVIHSKHIRMISRIQHERLIHLLVTVFVGMAMAFSFFETISNGQMLLIFFDLPLLFLFIGYLFHYRYLENTTQKWYEYEDKLLGIKGKA